MEVGQGQASEVTDLFRDTGWMISPHHHKVFQDLSRIDRVVAVKRQRDGL